MKKQVLTLSVIMLILTLPSQGQVGKYHDDKSNDFVLVLTQQAECEINVTTWFKMNLSLGYRLVSGVNDNSFIYPDINNFSGFAGNDFNSPVVGMSFLFGFFR